MNSPVNRKLVELNDWTIATLFLSLFTSILDFIFGIYGLIISVNSNIDEALCTFKVKEK
jgi:hypothetical protein